MEGEVRRVELPKVSSCKPKTRDDVYQRCRALIQNLFTLLSSDERDSRIIEDAFSNRLTVFKKIDFYSNIDDLEGSHLTLFWNLFLTALIDELNASRYVPSRMQIINYLPCLAGWLGYAISDKFESPELPTGKKLMEVLFQDAWLDDESRRLYVFFATAVFSSICEKKQLEIFFGMDSTSFSQKSLAHYLIDLDVSYDINDIDDSKHLEMIFVKYALFRYKLLLTEKPNKRLKWLRRLKRLERLERTDKPRDSRLYSHLSFQLSRAINESAQNDRFIYTSEREIIPSLSLNTREILFGTNPQWTKFVRQIDCERILSRRRIYNLKLQALTQGSIRIGIYKVVGKPPFKYTMMTLYDPFENYRSYESRPKRVRTKPIPYDPNSIIDVYINTQTDDYAKVLQFSFIKEGEVKHVEFAANNAKNLGNLGEWEQSNMFLGIELSLFQAVRVLGFSTLE